MSPRLPALRPRRVLQALQRAGFFVHHTTGSHYVLKHPDKLTLRVMVPYHNKDLKRRTLASIIEQAGMTADEFIRLL
jgi:predicted RNA binding protein YcfA (HicA-like mRNA interferase family)